MRGNREMKKSQTQKSWDWQVWVLRGRSHSPRRLRVFTISTWTQEAWVTAFIRIKRQVQQISIGVVCVGELSSGSKYGRWSGGGAMVDIFCTQSPSTYGPQERLASPWASPEDGFATFLCLRDCDPWQSHAHVKQAFLTGLHWLPSPVLTRYPSAYGRASVLC